MLQAILLLTLGSATGDLLKEEIVRAVDNAPIIGSCISNGVPVELSELWFLENREIRADSLASHIGIELRRRAVHIQVDDSGGAEYIWNIGSIVGGVEGDADVYLKLALLNGQLLVYWRETYHHRSYRQGLFTVEGHVLTPLCEGTGGEVYAH